MDPMNKDLGYNPLLDDEEEDDYATLPKLSPPEAAPSPEGLPELPPLGDTTFQELFEDPPEPLNSGEPLFQEPTPPPPSDPLQELLEAYQEVDPTPEPLGSDTLEDLLIEPEDTYDHLRTVEDYGILRVEEEGEEDFHDPVLDLDAVITKAIDMGASDIHLAPYDKVAFTVLGEIVRIDDFGVIEPNMTVKLEQSIISNVLEQAFVEDLELDTSYVVKSGRHKGRRLRLSIGKTEGDIFLVFRVIAERMPTPDELDIPQAMRSWVNLPNGLVLVNGPTGSGKSTTLSSLIQEIQFQRAEKIITIERPVEFVYGVKPGQKAYITQREVGKDSRSFSAALTSAMRQAPNIILVGEVRTREEIDELLRAAETGHLAISTMHTTSCPATINRIRSMYQGDEQLRVLATLSDMLRGMMTQTLVKSPDGTKRTAVREVLQVDDEIKRYILAGDVQAMRTYQEERGITMEHELVKAVRRRETSLIAARSKAPNPLYFDALIED